MRPLPRPFSRKWARGDKRAADIRARYAYGSVDIPADRFMNMAGDFADIDAAWDFASAGGIPITGIISGGQVSKMRM
ncbi:MAG: hypothetical protein FWC42_09920 [Proteobacteria bacterium]|nr:hypothetical protein [Pseudomonadota bacterium]